MADWEHLLPDVPTNADTSDVVMEFRAHPGACPYCQMLNGTQVLFGTMPDQVSHPNCLCSVVDVGRRLIAHGNTRRYDRHSGDYGTFKSRI
jgi:hypothetical protein